VDQAANVEGQGQEILGWSVRNDGPSPSVVAILLSRVPRCEYGIRINAGHHVMRLCFEPLLLNPRATELSEENTNHELMKRLIGPCAGIEPIP